MHFLQMTLGRTFYWSDCVSCTVCSALLGVFVFAADAGRIDALLKFAYKWSFSRDTVTLNEL